MHTRHQTFSLSPRRVALALGTLSALTFSPHAAFAQLPITTVASFTGTSGAYPVGGVTLDSNGNLFGTTQSGGTNGGGTVFEIAKGSNTVTNLASFTGSSLTDGYDPSSGVTFDSGGNLFGTTSGGGASGDGTVFEIAKGSSAITDLASFTGANGAYPIGGITLDSSGNLFGTTQEGGNASNGGTVFEIAKGSTTITNLASFTGLSPTNGYTPLGGVTFDTSGDLFGTAYEGGANGAGTVYEIAKGSSTITDLASFNGANGAYSTSAVTLDGSGNLFGTTQQGGASGDGTVFEIVGAANASPAPEPSQWGVFSLGIAGLAALILRARRRVVLPA